MTDYQRYSSSYRATETRQVMDWIRAGQCGSVIGFYGIGKSNFLRFLLREDIHSQYLGKQSNDFIFILIDLHSLVEVTDWAVYELILNQLVEQLHSSRIEDLTINELKSLHQTVLLSRDPLTAQRAIYKSVDVLYKRQGRRIALLFDEFDSVLNSLNSSIFPSLRAIRDAHKGQLSYIVAGIHEFTDLRENSADVEYFCELVNRNICRLGPYNEIDAKWTMTYLASQRSMEISDDDASLLFRLTGGHADLLNTILNILWGSEHQNSLNILLPNIPDQPAFQRACFKLWNSISEIEQRILCSLANKEFVAQKEVQLLKLRGLISQNNTASAICFSPLFTSFVQQRTSPSIQNTYISRSPQIIQLDGQPIDNITPLEFELLFYLYENRGHVCTKDELIKNVYAQRYSNPEQGVTDESLQALISRLRDKIEPNPQHPQYIVTVRKEGYKFIVNTIS